ncbi:MAG: hypothetical protein MZU95_12850 [Desulfomicrobium escambiense]|nr:hypothetical protein [Desulfomicrobium escambiense]
MDGVGGLPADGKSELEAAPQAEPRRAGRRRGVCGLSRPGPDGHHARAAARPTSALFGYDPLTLPARPRHPRGPRLGRRGRPERPRRPAAISPRSGAASSSTAGPGASRPRRTSASAATSTPAFPSARGSRSGSSRARSTASWPASRPRAWPTPCTDADPQKEGQAPIPTAPLAPEAAKASAIVNRFLDDVAEVLNGEAKANAALLRGFSKFPSIPTMQELFKLRPAAIANYPMYKGLAKLLGMDVCRRRRARRRTSSTPWRRDWAQPRFLLRPLQEDRLGRRGRQVRGQGRGDRGPRPVPSPAPGPQAGRPRRHPRPLDAGLSQGPLLASEPVPARLADGRASTTSRRSPSGPAPRACLGRFRSISAMPLDAGPRAQAPKPAPDPGSKWRARKRKSGAEGYHQSDAKASSRPRRT